MTAVEWLVEQIFNIDRKLSIEDIIKEAKKMEKKQIMAAWLTTKPITFNGFKNEFEEYYNKKNK